MCCSVFISCSSVWMFAAHVGVLTTVFHRASITGVKAVGKNRRDNIISSFEKVLNSLFVLTAERSLELVNFLSRCVTFSQ